MISIFDELNKPSNILIIGNGFDKHCGLDSNFRDYFLTTFYDNGNPNPLKIINNLWNLIFFYAFLLPNDRGGTLIKYVNNSNPLWMDVEGYINSIFMCDRGCLLIHPLYTFVDNVMRSDESALYNDARTVSGHNWCLNGTDKEQRFNIKQRVLELREEYDYKTGIDLLFGELRRFEKAFSNYLKEEIIKKQIVYTREVNKFILSYIDNFGSRQLFVFSFNYTNNLGTSVENTHLYNVHGTIDNNNIIIGISDDDNLFSLAKKFCKGDRRVKNGNSKIQLPDNDEIREVIFYGCSFGPLDYSYYSFLFRKYGMESLKTKFVFLYSNYESDPDKNEKNRDRLISNIENTIKRFLSDSRSQYNYQFLADNRTIVIEELESFKN